METAAIIARWVIIISAVLNYGFLTYDGSRGLIKGDYLRPKTGEYAGQLGPWAKGVSTVGIDPESTFMKSIFVVLGLGGLAITFCFAMGYAWSWAGMLTISIFTLWYLVPGTGLSILQILLLVILKILR